MEQAYKSLLEKYNLLLEENKKMKAELARLKGETSLSMPESEIPTEFSTSSINKHSSPEEKIRLFRSLFKGREDVFARRWYSKTTDKSGYQPVCENEWNEKYCDKKKYKCSICPNRKLMPLTDKAIYRHLSGTDSYGRDVVGIYPMLADETCLFLCADFDEENFKSDVTAFKITCEEYDIPVSVEISRSGNGAHVWIFFEEPVLASVARKLGSGILTRTMEKSNLSFKSYDRFFPNQDTMPKGGFGNLVALPLQGNARKNGNSLFVDENFIPYPDQWEYLGSVQKLSIKKVDELVSVLCKSGDLGKLISDQEDKPWKTKKQIEITAEDYPESLEIIRSNMLYIPSKDLSAGVQNKIKRLAAFKNPDFYRSQAMRLPIYDKPRIICTADIFDEYIALPRGCEDALLGLFVGARTEITITDETNHGTEIPVEFNGALREEQQPATDALLEHNIGVLSATTAEGVRVDDIVETVNHFRCIDEVIDNATLQLSEKFIKSLHYILKTGTSDSKLDWFSVGDYKKLPNEVGGRETTLPEDVAFEMKNLLANYNANKEKTLYDIIEFHVQFERIHPFQDGNGRIGRLIMLKECLKHNIVPFIIEDDIKMFYYRGLKEWSAEKGYLTDTCLFQQDKFKKYLEYFRIEFED